METLLPSSSVLVAFIGGMVALAAPCCITFLLPSYLAGVYQARAAVLALTFVFGLGIATVILPIALGVAALSRLVSEWHTEVFIIGGVFLLFLGTWSLMGRNLALPFRPSAASAAPGVLSIYGLGVFSGAASSCCAPVLIGVLTLTALTSTILQAGAVALAYVFGMVFPLLLAGYLWDRFNVSNNFLFRGRPLGFRLGGLSYRVHTTNLTAGILFWAMGVLILVLTFTGQLADATQAQTSLFDEVNAAADWLTEWLGWLPGMVTGLLLAVAFLFLLRAAFRHHGDAESAPGSAGQLRGPPKEAGNPRKGCHD